MKKERLKLTFAFVLFLITAAVVVFFSYEMIANFKTQIKYMTPAQVEVHVQDYERVHDDTSTIDQRSYEEERNNKYGVMASDYTKKLLSDADTLYLEYDVDINDIEIELRIYQNNKVRIHIPERTELVPIMDKIITSSKLLEEWENGLS